MFGTHWSTFVDARVLTKSDSAIFANSIFGDARVETKTVSAIFPNSRANNSGFFWFDLFHNHTNLRPYGQTYCGQVWY